MTSPPNAASARRPTRFSPALQQLAGQHRQALHLRWFRWAVRRTTARRVRASLRRVFGDEPPGPVAELAAHPATGLRAIVAELRVAHDRLVAWADGRLVLGGPRWWEERVVNLGPGGLVLMPVALGSAHVLIKGNTTTQTTVRYPARGVGALWTAGTRTPSAGVARLLGPARASLPEALRSPATTTDLARVFAVTPSAVSQHLLVLRENGLVARERSGRGVLHLTTSLGEALLSPVTRVSAASP